MAKTPQFWVTINNCRLKDRKGLVMELKISRGGDKKLVFKGFNYGKKFGLNYGILLDFEDYDEEEPP